MYKRELCEVLHKEFSKKPLRIINTDRTSRSIAVPKSVVGLSRCECRLSLLKSYLKATNTRRAVKVLGKGLQGTATLMRVKISSNGVLNFVEKLTKIPDETQYAFSSLPRTFNKLLDDEEHLVNEASDFAKYDVLFLNKRVLLLEPFIELAGLLLLSQCVSQNICPNFPLFYGVIVSPDTFRFDIEVAHGGETFHKWSTKRHSVMEWNAAIFQVLVGLHTMHSKFNMTHDDLHTDNVLVNEVPAKVKGKPTFIHYILNGGDYYIPTFGKLFLLIDFGRINVGSKVKLNWHRKILDKNIQGVDGVSAREVYDYFHFVRYLLRNAPKPVKSFVLEVLLLSATSDLLIGEVLISLFDSKLNGFTATECNKAVACFDIRPKQAAVVGTYNLDKKLAVSKLPTTLRRLAVVN